MSHCKTFSVYDYFIDGLVQDWVTPVLTHWSYCSLALTRRYQDHNFDVSLPRANSTSRSVNAGVILCECVNKYDECEQEVSIKAFIWHILLCTDRSDVKPMGQSNLVVDTRTSKQVYNHLVKSHQIIWFVGTRRLKSTKSVNTMQWPLKKRCCHNAVTDDITGYCYENLPQWGQNESWNHNDFQFSVSMNYHATISYWKKWCQYIILTS